MQTTALRPPSPAGAVLLHSEISGKLTSTSVCQRAVL